MLVLFSGEQPSLDNKEANNAHNSPRNIGFVKVPRDMDDRRVLSKGPTETGGYYNFGGSWSPQENKGVNWLTHSESLEDNSVRIKVTRLSKGQILVLFETWTGTKFVSSKLMTVDDDGKITRSPKSSKFAFRMPWADEILSTGSNTAVFFASVKGKLLRYEIALVSGPGSGVTEAKPQPQIDGPGSSVKAPGKNLGVALRRRLVVDLKPCMVRGLSL